MQINNRIDIKNLILHIENNYAVNDWKVNGIHIWPFLRINLYMSIIFALENPKPTFTQKTLNSKKSISLYNRIVNKYKRVKAQYILNRWFQSLPQKEHLFIGFDSHRVDYKNSRFNRFFDTYISNNSLFNNYMYLELGVKSSKSYFDSSNIYFCTEFNKIFDSLIDRNQILDAAKISLVGYDDFISFISTQDFTQNFTQNFNFKINKHNLKRIFIQVNFFEIILAKINPKIIYALCYYDTDVMMLMAVANRMNIKTVEYQHGPQMDVHLAYSHWSVIPQEGYDMLPRTFWNWDRQSSNNVNNWAEKHDLYQSKIVGNFWIDYWKKQTLVMNETDFILYTLQPTPVTIEQLFPDNLVSYIKNNNIKWYFRLHPRQIGEKEKIIALIKKKNIEDKINIDNAYDLPLPILLFNCKVHLTHFSGSTIEADQMGKFTILINQLGVDSYHDLIINNKASFIDPSSDDFHLQLNNILSFYDKKQN